MGLKDIYRESINVGVVGKLYADIKTRGWVRGVGTKCLFISRRRGDEGRGTAYASGSLVHCKSRWVCMCAGIM